ncbi:MAG: sensor histidine kinase [Anaerotruncus massiliensis (ex Togo et al. 2019)]
MRPHHQRHPHRHGGLLLPDLRLPAPPAGGRVLCERPLCRPQPPGQPARPRPHLAFPDGGGRPAALHRGRGQAATLPWKLDRAIPPGGLRPGQAGGARPLRLRRKQAPRHPAAPPHPLLLLRRPLPRRLSRRRRVGADPRRVGLPRPRQAQGARAGPDRPPELGVHRAFGRRRVAVSSSGGFRQVRHPSGRGEPKADGVRLGGLPELRAPSRSSARARRSCGAPPRAGRPLCPDDLAGVLLHVPAGRRHAHARQRRQQQLVGQKEETDLETLLLDAAEWFEPAAAEKQIRISVSLPEETLPRCRCDQQRIRQVLSILVDNAVSYAGEGGRVVLSAGWKRGWFSIRVADNGPGIPDAEKARVFDRFYRADKARSGREHYGLGLSIAREIAALHRGRLTAGDTPGGGATFTLSLPGGNPE